MLIANLQRIKEHLAFQRLYIIHARHDSRFCLAPKTIEWELGRIALIESEITVLQHRLSFVCSLMCGCLDEWGALDARLEIQGELIKLLSDIKLKFNRPAMSKIATVVKSRPQGTFDELVAHRATIEKYLGYKLSFEKPDLSGFNVTKKFLEIVNTDVQDFHSITYAVKEIGKDEAHYWKLSLSFKDQPSRPNLYQDRMN